MSAPTHESIEKCLELYAKKLAINNNLYHHALATRAPEQARLVAAKAAFDCEQHNIELAELENKLLGTRGLSVSPSGLQEEILEPEVSVWKENARLKAKEADKMLKLRQLQMQRRGAVSFIGKLPLEKWDDVELGEEDNRGTEEKEEEEEKLVDQLSDLKIVNSDEDQEQLENDSSIGGEGSDPK